MKQIEICRKNLVKYFAVAAIILLLAPQAKLSAAESLSLDDCVQLALTQNHGLKSVRLDAAAKQVQAKGAQGLSGPKIDLVGNYQRQEDPTGIIPAHGLTIPPVYDDRQKQWGFNLKQNLYDAGKTNSLIRYYEENANWQQAELKSQTTAIVNGVVKGFNRLLQLNETLRAERDSVQALSSLADDIRMKYSLGRLAGVDVLQIEAQVAAEQEKLARYQSDYDRQLALLKSYIGYEQTRPLVVQGTLRDQAVAITVTGDINENPEVTKNRIRQAQSKELLTTAKADNQVQLSLNGSYRVTEVGRADAAKDEMWIVGLQLTIPVFDGGVINANIRQTRLQLDRANESYAQSVSEAQAALAAACANANAAKIRVESARLAWNRFQEAYRIMELSYKTGKTSLTDALVAQSAATNAEATYYQAVFDEVSAQIDLKAVYGQTAYPVSSANLLREEGSR